MQPVQGIRAQLQALVDEVSPTFVLPRGLHHREERSSPQVQRPVGEAAVFPVQSPRPSRVPLEACAEGLYDQA